MKFRTEIEIKERFPGAINHSDSIWTIGSCFADEIGDKMLAEGFNVEVNPLGTLYNPSSILRSIRNVVEGKRFETADFFEHEGKFRNFDFHSLFAKRTAEESAKFVNETIERLRNQLKTLSVVILTFGSSRCFRLKSTGEVVANCHKQHPAIFTEEDIAIDTCVGAIDETINLLRGAAPNLRTIVFTVSPIRHKAYGLHADKLSKSRLLISVNDVLNQAVAKSIPPVSTFTYFPSYEIMMDDLRDYRFYAADMVHPSPTAVDYIYEHFADTFYTPATRSEAADRLRAFRRSLHRPL